jgi:hypothetical protein
MLEPTLRERRRGARGRRKIKTGCTVLAPVANWCSTCAPCNNYNATHATPRKQSHCSSPASKLPIVAGVELTKHLNTPQTSITQQAPHTPQPASPPPQLAAHRGRFAME